MIQNVFSALCLIGDFGFVPPVDFQIQNKIIQETQMVGWKCYLLFWEHWPTSKYNELQLPCQRNYHIELHQQCEWRYYNLSQLMLHLENASWNYSHNSCLLEHLLCILKYLWRFTIKHILIWHAFPYSIKWYVM